MKRFIAAFTSLFLSTFSFSQQPVISQLIKNKDFKSAVLEINKGIAQDPYNDVLFVQRGICFFNLHELQKAIDDYQKAIALKPKQIPYYLTKANFEFRNAQLKEAFETYEKAIKVNREHEQIYFQRAILFMNLKKYEEALLDLNAAIALKKDNAQFYLQRATVYLQLEKQNFAQSDFIRTTQLDSFNHHAYIGLGELYYTNQQHYEACNSFEKAIKIAQSKKRLADVNYLTNVIDQLCENNTAQYYCQRGIGAYDKGDFEHAKQIYLEGLAKFPNSILLRHFLGNTCMNLKQYEKASSYYNQTTNHKEKLLAEINSIPNFQSLTTTESYYTNILVTSYSSIALSKLLRGEFNKSIPYYDTAIQTLEDLPKTIENKLLLAEYHMQKACAYTKLKSWDLAQIELDKSNILAPTLPEVNVLKAYVKLLTLTHPLLNSSAEFEAPFVPIKFTFPSEKIDLNEKQIESLLRANLECEKAIKKDPEYGIIYIVQANIQNQLDYSNLCKLILKAKDAGITNANQALNGNCN